MSSQDSAVAYTYFNTEQLTVRDLSYWQFFIKNALKAEQILFDGLVLKYYPEKKLPKKDSVSLGVEQLLKTIIIEKIEDAELVEESKGEKKRRILFS